MNTPLKLLSSQKTHIIIAISLIIIGGSMAFYFSGASGDSIGPGQPNFKALTPPDKKPDWKQSSPQGGKKETSVYIYNDKIGDIPIKVSQQPLPPSFRDDPASKVSEMAADFNASNSMQVGGVSIYIGTSAKGPQSVIFARDNLLVLIKSDNHIPEGSWADYIKELKVN